MLDLLTYFSLAPSGNLGSKFLCLRRRAWLSALLREMLAEYLATLFLFFFGACVNAQLVIGGGLKGDYFANQFCWGLGIVVGCYIAGGVSGAHMNPAVTLAMAVHRGFEYYKVVGYWIAQFGGALSASALCYAVYYDAVNAFDVPPAGEHFLTDKSGGIFYTLEAPWLTVRGAIVDNVLGTACLLLGLAALNDAKNFNPVASNLAPLLIGLLVCGIATVLGMNAGAAINPVRDFPQRLFCSFAGWGGGVFSRHENYWLVPLLCPFLGAQLGIVVYDLCIQAHHDPHYNSAGEKEDVEEPDDADKTTPGKDTDHAMSAEERNASMNESGDSVYIPVARLPAGGIQSSASSDQMSSGEHHAHAHARPVSPSSVNIYAVGGRNSAGLRESTGMVHTNQAFLDPAIAASAEATFHRGRKKNKSSMGGANMNQPLLPDA